MNSTREESIKRVSTIVDYLAAEVSKEEPPEGSVYCILRVQQKQMLAMWTDVLVALTDNYKVEMKELEEDKDFIFRKYTNLETVYSTLREELSQLKACVDTLQALLEITGHFTSTEYLVGFHNGVSAAYSVFSGEAPSYIDHIIQQEHRNEENITTAE